MDDVAELAGVAKGSLYYNFSSKDKPLRGAVAGGRRRARRHPPRGARSLHGRAAIEALITVLLDRIEANAGLAKLMAAEIFRTDRAWQKTLFALRHDALAVFAEAIAEAEPATAAAGTSGLMASSVFGAVLMAGLEWLVFEPERHRDEVSAAILASLSGALAPR